MLKQSIQVTPVSFVAAIAVLCCGISCSSQVGTAQLPTATVNGALPRLLIFSKTAGYRHASIPAGIVAIRQLAAEHHIAVDATEDAALFTDANLARYKAIIFLNTTGTIFDQEQAAAFERYIHAGGGYVGIHSASDTEHQWAWYGQLVGAFFKSHPAIAQATITVEDHNNPSTVMLPDNWVRTDEWYSFATNPRKHVHVLLTVDETTYHGGMMGRDHPIAWYHAFDGGRAWYTALGHTVESYSEPLFRGHIWGGISYAAGLATA